jgi:predicted negative regulator of RcsB-dependent stress response
MEAARVGSNLDAALAARLAQVVAERDTAEQRLARLQQATQEEWSDLQAGLATTLDSLDVRIDRLRMDLHRRVR